MKDSQIIAQIKLRPEMFGIHRSFVEAVPFLEGFDLGRGMGMLAGFNEWLAVKLGLTTSLNWRRLVFEAHSQVIPDATGRIDGQSDDQWEFDILFDLLLRCVDEMENVEVRRSIHEQYLSLQGIRDGENPS